MKKTNYQRRSFLKKLTTGAFSFAVAPSLSSHQPNDQNKQEIDFLPKLFDCNKYLGDGFPVKPDYPKVSDLLKQMNRLNINRSLAWHTRARSKNPMSGNELLLEEIKSSGAKDRIFPSFIITPSIGFDKENLNSFLDLVKKNNIRAFHFFPEEAGWPALQDISSIIKELNSLKPVLFLNSFQSLIKQEEIADFARSFPEVTIVMTDAAHFHYHSIFKLMDDCHNICLDTSLLHKYRIIVDVVERYGANRILFGTGYKSNNGASIASLVHANITNEQFQLIAHGNLEQLMQITHPLEGYTPIVGDRLWHKLLRKEPLGVKILDAHTHQSRAVAKWDDSGQTDFEGYAHLSLRSMNSIGVKTNFVAEYSFYPPDAHIGKTYMEKNLGHYEDRFKGYLCALSFTSEYKDQMIPRLDEIFSRKYYVGFKIHNDYWQIPITDPCFNPMWEYANAHHLPILIHCWNTEYNSPKLLKEIIPRYPNTIFILGHSGNTDRPDAEQLVKDNSNVYLEWCGSFLNPADWCETIEILGNKRILYGSDSVSWISTWGHDPVWEMGRLLSLDVPDETLIPILGQNMQNILDQKI